MQALRLQCNVGMVSQATRDEFADVHKLYTEQAPGNKNNYELQRDVVADDEDDEALEYDAAERGEGGARAASVNGWTLPGWAAIARYVAIIAISLALAALVFKTFKGDAGLPQPPAPGGNYQLTNALRDAIRAASQASADDGYRVVRFDTAKPRAPRKPRPVKVVYVPRAPRTRPPAPQQRPKAAVANRGRVGATPKTRKTPRKTRKTPKTPKTVGKPGGNDNF